MKINDFSLTGLHNEEHYQFHADFKGLTDAANPATMNIQAAYAAYLPVFADEGIALDVIRKSAVTDDIAQADTLRDSTFRGFSDAVKSAGRHFNPAVKQAAARMQVVLGQYGNLTTKSYNEETAAISSLLTDLTTTAAADITTLGLSDWVAELQANNEAFDNLMKSRYTEESGKTMLQMKQVRTLADAAYRAITERINALILINGETGYTNFVNELNQRIESYSLILAQRKGRNAKNIPPPPLTT
ncbi:MAG: DUF6261 family protein [Bacteroidota bacterium]